MSDEASMRAEAETNKLTKDIIGAAIEVHRTLGPGLLESAYETCLAYELTTRGHKVRRQVSLPVVYKGVTVECGYRIDLLVDECVVIEMKSVERIESIHKMQLLSYLRLSGHRAGLLMNFNVEVLVHGLTRIVNSLKE